MITVRRTAGPGKTRRDNLRRQLLGAVLSLFAGCGGDDGLITVGETCRRVAGPKCDRAIACGIGPDRNKQSCVNAVVNDCCTKNGNCEARAADDAAETRVLQYIADCSAGYASYDCSRLATGGNPPACDSFPDPGGS